MTNLTPSPRVRLVEKPHSSRWAIELENVDGFESLLGRDVLAEFCRCFVHADRITSTVSAIYASERLHGRDSVAFGRDLHTMVWFQIGTLRELALGIRALRAALKRKGILDASSESWLELRELEQRWEDNESFRKMRDKAAFHVDRDVIDRGLDELTNDPVVELSKGDGPKSVKASLTLGLLAMHNGLGMNPDEYGQFLDKVADGLGIVHAIQAAFVEAANSVGISFQEGV
jgi:hypothetical protein